MKITDTPQKLVALGVASLAILSAIWWLIEWRVEKYIKDVSSTTTSKCVIIPPSGHVIDSASPGEWATITWHNIERINNCGRPELTAVVVNGDGIFHDVALSTSGINLDTGVTPVLRYKFKIPEGASPGSAWFRVTLDFPQEGRSINSARVFFVILPPQVRKRIGPAPKDRPSPTPFDKRGSAAIR